MRYFGRRKEESLPRRARPEWKGGYIPPYAYGYSYIRNIRRLLNIFFNILNKLLIINLFIKKN